MSEVKLLRAAWVFPVTAPLLKDGAVLLVGDRIARVDRYKSLQRIAPTGVERWEFLDTIILPGLVNPHTHLENSHFAQVVRRPQPFGRWLRQMVQQVRQQSFEQALAAARDGVQQLLRYGVTTVGEFSRLGASFQALQESGLRGVVFKEFICLSNEELPERLRELSDWVQQTKASAGNLRLGVGPHAPYTVTPLGFRQVLALAAEQGLPVCTHAAESPAERELVEHRKGIWRWWLGKVLREAPKGLSPIRYLDWLGVLREGTLLVHCVQVDENDIALLSQRPVWIAHCPRSNANLQVGTMPLVALKRAGARVCLATDGLASVDSLSPLDELRFARSLIAQTNANNFVLTPEQWLRMVTIDAAAALGLDKEAGSLEPGKFADFALFTLSPNEKEPLEALLSQATETSLTMIGGRIVWQQI